MKKIKFHSTPEGFPPDWIRELWVGEEIPLADVSDAIHGPGLKINLETMDIESGLPEGYLVNVYDALEVMREKSQEAWEWFIARGFGFGPESRNQPFCIWSFNASSCDLIDA